MEDILLMQLLKKKGIISDKDIHELHELTSSSMNTEPVYLSEQSNEHFSEIEARDIVSKMYHIEGGRKYIGEKFSIDKAKEICDRYKSILPSHISSCDLYVAINSQYHDYCMLFKSWFSSDIDTRIIESAIYYWFKDCDYIGINKVHQYLKGT